MAKKCPKCKDDFPKGGRFCSNCGFEPMSRTFLITVLIRGVLLAILLTGNVILKNWVLAVLVALLVVLLGYEFANRFRLSRATVPDELEGNATSCAVEKRP